MKTFDVRLRNGGDDAVAAASEMVQAATQEVERLRLNIDERRSLAWAIEWIKQSTPNGMCPRALVDVLDRLG